jgi:hypothetical protein
MWAYGAGEIDYTYIHTYVQVKLIVPGSAAYYARTLRKQDVITHLDGNEADARTAEDILMGSDMPGSTVTIRSVHAHLHTHTKQQCGHLVSLIALLLSARTSPFYASKFPDHYVDCSVHACVYVQ